MKTSASRVAPIAQVLLPVGALCLVAAQLLWEFSKGGVVSHNILNRADLPAISNWWGMLTVPALAWLAARNAERAQRLPASIALGFGVAFAIGVTISVLFRSNIHEPILYVLGGAMLAGLVWPAYRLECLLGFVVGMMFVFGGVLPLAIGGIIAAVSALFHWVVWRGIFKRK